jgi:uncharacterized SAM-binding protein YcdF (DUF218 family)
MTILRLASYGLLLLLALALLWLGGYLAFAAWVAAMKPGHLDRPTDAVIVLTGGARRINTGLELLAEGHAPQLYISGVNQAVSLKEILGLWQSDAAEKSAAACCIVLDYKAQNTAQNASETRDWVRRENIHSIRLVTSSYHMPRAWLDFRHELPDIEILPYPVVSIKADLKSGRFWTITFIEYHKTILTMMHTGISPFFQPGSKP